MLDPDIRREIEAELAHLPDRRAGTVEALHVVQRHFGWVSDEHLQEVAALLGMGAAELDGVASFYNLIYRKPVGRNVILVCDSVTCWMMGADRVCQALRQRLGVGFAETTADGAFTVLPMCCLGDCDHAPVLMV